MRVSTNTVTIPRIAQIRIGLATPGNDLADHHLAHERRDGVLRRKPAGVEHHQALRHRVHAERENHRRCAEVSNPEPVDEADQHAREDTERDGQRVAGRLAEEPGRGGRHHRAHGDRPRDRKVDVAEQDDQHHPCRHHTEEGGGQELLRQVLPRQEVGVVERTKEQEKQDAGERDRRRLVDARGKFLQPVHRPPLPVKIELVLDTEQSRANRG